MSVQRIKKNDTVIAIAGVNAGKTGRVLRVFPDQSRALVEGVNVVKKMLRKSQDHPEGGIAEQEAPIAMSKLMLYCPRDKKGVRIGRVKDGDKVVRKCKVCGHVFEG